MLPFHSQGLDKNESSVVDAAKKDDVIKSGLVAGIDVLKACYDSKDDADCNMILKTLMVLADECPETQAFKKGYLGLSLLQAYTTVLMFVKLLKMLLLPCARRSILSV